jgi:hypothetical protein
MVLSSARIIAQSIEEDKFDEVIRSKPELFVGLKSSLREYEHRFLKGKNKNMFSSSWAAKLLKSIGVVSSKSFYSHNYSKDEAASLSIRFVATFLALRASGRYGDKNIIQADQTGPRRSLPPVASRISKHNRSAAPRVYPKCTGLSENATILVATSLDGTQLPPLILLAGGEKGTNYAFKSFVCPHNDKFDFLELENDLMAVTPDGMAGEPFKKTSVRDVSEEEREANLSSPTQALKKQKTASSGARSQGDMETASEDEDDSGADSDEDFEEDSEDEVDGYRDDDEYVCNCDVPCELQYDLPRSGYPSEFCGFYPDVEVVSRDSVLCAAEYHLWQDLPTGTRSSTSRRGRQTAPFLLSTAGDGFAELCNRVAHHRYSTPLATAPMSAGSSSSSASKRSKKSLSPQELRGAVLKQAGTDKRSMLGVGDAEFLRIITDKKLLDAPWQTLYKDTKKDLHSTVGEFQRKADMKSSSASSCGEIFYFTQDSKTYTRHFHLVTWLKTSVIPFADPEKRILLIIDSYSCHTSHLLRKAVASLPVDILFVPPGFTALLQPLDLAVNRPIKCDFKKTMSRRYRIINDDTVSEQDKKNALTMPPALHLQSLAHACQNVKISATVNGFKKMLKNAVDQCDKALK